MIHRVTIQQFRRGLAGAALAAGLALLASPASAGQCPADKTKAGVRTSGEMKPKPRPLATIARIQSSRSLRYAVSQASPCSFHNAPA